MYTYVIENMLKNSYMIKSLDKGFYKNRRKYVKRA